MKFNLTGLLERSIHCVMAAHQVTIDRHTRSVRRNKRKRFREDKNLMK